MLQYLQCTRDKNAEHSHVVTLVMIVALVLLFPMLEAYGWGFYLHAHGKH
jgi:hypothetical protein